MIFKKLSILAAAAIASVTASGADAAVLGVFTHTYGIGQYDPSGNDVLGNGFVTVSDQSTGRFSDSFNFSSVGAATIDSLELTLDFSGAGPSGFLNLGEAWNVRVQGSNSSASSDDYFGLLVSANSPQTFTLSALTDTGSINAFLTSIATQTLTFWFAENTTGADSFRLNSASLTVNGTAAVPLPAAGFLLLGALGGIAALRRRKTA